MAEVIDLSPGALLCGKKSRACRQDVVYIDDGIYIADYISAGSENGDVETHTIAKRVPSSFRLTPSIDAKEFSLSKILASGVVPQVVPTTGGVHKLDAVQLVNATANSLNERYDNVMRLVEAQRQAEEQAKAQPVQEPLVEPSKKSE